MNLRRWLRRDPKPASLRADGRVITVPTSGNVWADLEATIESIGPAKLEAIGADGSLLRAIDLEVADDGLGASDGAQQRAQAHSELAAIARMISDAHDAGAKRHAQAYEVAFARHTELVAILAQRLSGLETAWQRAMQQLAQAQADVAMAQASGQESGDPAGAAIAAMLGSVAPAMLNGSAKVKA